MKQSCDRMTASQLRVKSAPMASIRVGMITRSLPQKSTLRKKARKGADLDSEGIIINIILVVTSIVIFIVIVIGVTVTGELRRRSL